MGLGKLQELRIILNTAQKFTLCVGSHFIHRPPKGVVRLASHSKLFMGNNCLGNSTGHEPLYYTEDDDDDVEVLERGIKVYEK